MRRPIVSFLTAILVAAGSPLAAQPRLSAHPAQGVADALPEGVSPVGKSAFAYRPTGLTGAAPGLLLLFHGAGGDARRFVERFTGEADRRRLILLSIQSIDNTWDLVLRNSRDRWSIGRASPVHATGADGRRVNAALRQLFAQIAIDPKRVVAAGFSDGASYALSLGLDNDQLFSGIVALAPGFVAEGTATTRQRIAIAHGRSDRILSYANAERIASDLRNRGMPVIFIPFDGDHMVESGSLAAALDFVLPAPASR